MEINRFAAAHCRSVVWRVASGASFLFTALGELLLGHRRLRAARSDDSRGLTVVLQNIAGALAGRPFKIIDKPLLKLVDWPRSAANSSRFSGLTRSARPDPHRAISHSFHAARSTGASEPGAFVFLTLSRRDARRSSRPSGSLWTRSTGCRVRSALHLL